MSVYPGRAEKPSRPPRPPSLSPSLEDIPVPVEPLKSPEEDLLGIYNYPENDIEYLLMCFNFNVFIKTNRKVTLFSQKFQISTTLSFSVRLY